MRKWLFFNLLMLVVMFLHLGVSAHAEENTDSVRSIIYSDINNYRVANGLSPLTYGEYELASDARAKEAERSWSHTRPDGTDYWTADERIYGENLAMPSFTTVNRVVPAWIDSPIHRSLLLASDFTSCCIGVYETSTGYYVSCEFGY